MTPNLTEAIVRMRSEGEQSLSAKATAGRWEHHQREASDSTVASVGPPNAPGRPCAVCVNPRYGKDEFDATDGPFIAAARDDAPLLADACDLLLRIVRAMFDQHGIHFGPGHEFWNMVSEFNARFPNVLEESK